jgi:hypothetical protein
LEAKETGKRKGKESVKDIKLLVGNNLQNY